MTDIGTHIIHIDGRIYSKPKRKFLKSHLTKAGYLRVKIGTRGYLLHRLIAIHFIPNPENKPEVNHRDGDKQNYAIDNLEWVTPHENSLHSYAAGLQSKKGSKNVKAILNEDRIKEIRSSEYSRRDLAHKYGVSLNTIHDILAKRTWNHVQSK